MCTQAFSRAVLATVSSLLLTAVNIWPACPKAVAEHARLATYDAADGQTYFALGLTAGLNKNLPGSHDVVVLFDTSASQMGAYREDALSALDSLLSTLPATDRVRLFAVDLEAVPMHDQFAACHSDAVAAARQQLEARAPLGATDLPRVVLRSLRDFANDRNVPRHLIYIGDGLSRANLLQGDELAELVATLASQRVSVSSYAVGSHCDISLLSALANHTGGNVVVDGERVSGQQAGTALAGIVHGEVLWPAAAKLPSEFAETYPLQFPPLRADRDSILIGRLEARATGAVAVESVVGEAVRKLQWQINPESSAVEFAFLPRLVEIARRDQGVSLPTFSSAALQEMRRFLLASADGISELGSRALASGDIESAKVLAEAALANDPGNEKAEVIQHAIQHRGDGVPEHQMQFRRAPEGLRVAQQPQPEASPAAPSLRAPTPPPAGTDAPLRLRGQDVGAFGDAPPEFGQQNGEFLDDVIARRRARDGVIRAEVRNGIADARDLLGSDPSAAVSELKLLLENARNAPDISGDLRAQLIDQIQSAIREGSRRTLVKTLRDAELAASRAQALDRLQIAKALQRRESRLSEILSRFDALMDEQRYDLAFDAALEAELLEPELPMTEVAVVSSALTREVATSTRLRKLRRRGFLDTFETVEQSLIPFPDEPPLVYPPREDWEALSARREKYATIDLATTGGAEERIFRALDKTADVDFLETALSDAVEILKDEYDIPIIIDEAALDIAGLDSSEPISLSLSGISLRSVLRLMLKAVDLTYVVQDEVLQITTIEEAEEQLVTKVYPVGDLVLPISSGLGFGLGGAGGIGGVGGGALGGAMNGGGMGGGFGGGMGGMGGMGGGMGGFGGGMGGGMFAVDDPVTLGEKNAPSVTPVASPRLQPRLPQVIRPDRTDKTPTAAWHEFFSSQRRAAPADQVRDADVRETVRQTMKSGQYAEVAALIQAALGHGFSQPWMYEALGLAMQAVEAPPAEIERALMSAIDITSSPDEIFFVAQYMSHIGLETRALSLFQQLAELNPARPEPYAAALKVALRLDDPAAVRWATVGVLKQAWAQDQREIEDHARRIAASALAELELEGRAAEAQEMRAELNQALARDCVARVSWTGDADVDILVSEPAGTVCSLRNPRTSSGGVMLGDASAATADESVQGMTETYVCSEAFPGKYRLLIRPVWGDVSAGKVTVEVATHYGTDRQQSIKRQIPLGENPAIVEFELGDGRRDEAIAEHQLGNAVQKQIEVGRAILAQQLNTLSSSEVAEELALNRFRNQALGGRLPLRLRGAVGFRPVITPLPEGTQFGATAVISANRKYVRISPQPVFSGVTSVATFNFVTGEEGGDGTNGGTGGNGGTGTGTGTGTGF